MRWMPLDRLLGYQGVRLAVKEWLGLHLAPHCLFG